MEKKIVKSYLDIGPPPVLTFIVMDPNTEDVIGNLVCWATNKEVLTTLLEELNSKIKLIAQ